MIFLGGFSYGSNPHADFNLKLARKFSEALWLTDLLCFLFVKKSTESFKLIFVAQFLDVQSSYCERAQLYNTSLGHKDDIKQLKDCTCTCCPLYTLLWKYMQNNSHGGKAKGSQIRFFTNSNYNSKHSINAMLSLSLRKIIGLLCRRCHWYYSLIVLFSNTQNPYIPVSWVVGYLQFKRDENVS